MKRVNFFIILMTLLLVGCNERSATPVPSRQSSSQANNLPESTHSSLQIFTQTPTQPQFEKSSTPIVMPTSVPSLSAVDKEEVIRELLKTNGNCDAPCFFGVVPKQTTLDEVRRRLDPALGNGLERKNAKGEVIVYSQSFSVGKWILGSIKFSLQSDIVQKIEVQIHGLNREGVRLDEWLPFSLDGILSTYGVPSNVIFSLDYPHEPVSNPGVLYSYSLLYKNYNAGISYMGGWKPSGSMINLCLSEEQPDFVTINIGAREFVNIGAGVEITKAASMTTEEFYRIFSQPNNSTCIDLKASAFR